MKTKTLAMLIAGTIVVGVGTAIAIAMPVSFKHNSKSSFFDIVPSQPESASNSYPDTSSNSIEQTTQQSFTYNVPGNVPVVAQPTDMTCWAAAATMMASWRDQKISYTIEEVMDKAGSFYRQKFDSNDGLFPNEEAQFFAGLGMRAEAPENYSAQGLLSLLQNYGPIFAIGNEGSSETPAIHARVITGISSTDGTVDNTFLQVNDPADGTSNTESLQNFAQKYEGVAIVDTNGGFALRMQIAHY